MAINQIAQNMSKVEELSCELTKSLKRPSSRTLRLLDRALSYLTPFESPQARTASPSERRALLALLATHRAPLSPYLDVDRIEMNLRFA